MEPVLHSKKIGSLRNPQKRFGRFKMVSKRLEMLKKRVFSSNEPLKVLPMDPRTEHFPTKPQKDFVRLYEAFKVLC